MMEGRGENRTLRGELRNTVRAEGSERKNKRKEEKKGSVKRDKKLARN